MKSHALGTAPASLLLLLLAACAWTNVTVEVATPAVSPSPLPRILSPTPPFLPSDTAVPDPTATAVPDLPTPTATATPAAELQVRITACDTSLDLSHGMGEVTNAYVLLQNYSPADLTEVCATLSASDEAREHPDKRACIASLPAGAQVSLKLTVDTAFRQDTALRVEVVSQDGFLADAEAPSCRDAGLPGRNPAGSGTVEPIP